MHDGRPSTLTTVADAGSTGSFQKSKSPRIELVPMTGPLCLEMARIARPGERREAEAFGVPLSIAVRRSYRGSIVSWAFLINGELAAAAGLGGAFLHDVGIPWLITGPLVEAYPFAFRRVAMEMVDKMLELTPILENYVLDDYTQAKRFLCSIGFSIGQPKPFGPKGAIFRRFWMN